MKIQKLALTLFTLILLLIESGCLVVQAQPPGRIYPGVASAPVSEYDCEIMTRFQYLPIPEGIVKTVESSLLTRGIKCDEKAPRKLHVEISYSVPDSYETLPLISASLSGATFLLLPGYMGKTRIDFFAFVEMQNKEVHHFTYTNTYHRFTWLFFIFASLSPTNYYTTHLVEATNECLDKFVADLPLALDAQPQARFNRVVVLKDGRIFYNARVTRSEGTYIAEFATGDRREFSPDEVLETRPSE